MPEKLYIVISVDFPVKIFHEYFYYIKTNFFETQIMCQYYNCSNRKISAWIRCLINRKYIQKLNKKCIINFYTNVTKKEK